MTPRVLFVGRNDYRLPLDESLARKWDALSERMELRVLASGTGTDPRFALVSPRRFEGPRFYLLAAGRVARELRTFKPDAVVTQSPFEAVAVELARRATRSPAKLDRRGARRLAHLDTALRLAGPALIGPLGDRLAGWAVRRADAHRAVSEFTASLVRAEGREPAAVFTTYSDLGVFAGPPAGAGGAARRLRRRARALQERRGARRGLADRRRARAGGAPPPDRLGAAGRGGRGARARRRRVGPPARAARGRSRRRSARGRSCSRRPPRACRASRSRRSCAAGPWSAAAAAASRTSSRTA